MKIRECSFLLLLNVACLFALGLLMVFNTTSAEVLGPASHKEAYHALLKQISYALLGVVSACGIYHLDYKKILLFSPYAFWFINVLLVLVFVPGIGMQINGAQRWIKLAGLYFQPSEVMKITMPLFYLHFITSSDETLKIKSFLKILGLLSIPIVLILFEPDNGTAAIMLVTLVALFFLTKVRWVYWALPIMVIATFGIIFASKMKHVADRIRIYLNPELDLLGKGHQPYQAKIAAGSGELFGKGLGKSFQKLCYLPEARSDYIAAIFAEEFGFIGILVMVIMYMLIGYLGFKIASLCKDKEGFFITSILTFLICFQAFLNLGVVSGLLPSKGTNLPFFSQGGSSLLANAITLAIILSVAKITAEKKSSKAIS